MFVVKRSFKNFGKVYTPGTVITEPAGIKRFNGRVAEGKIIEVTEKTFESVAKYFKDKYNVTLQPTSAPAEEIEEIEEVEEPEKIKESEGSKKPEVKVTVKAKAK